jgi:hypothetical protein
LSPVSNGFKLKHGILSDDEDVEVKTMGTSPNLNSDVAPLLYIYALFKIYAWLVLLEYLHVSHINNHLYCNHAQMTLIELYNKSHERFMLGKCQENASIGLKLRFKLYRDATLTCVDELRTVLAWSYTLNKS